MPRSAIAPRPSGGWWEPPCLATITAVVDIREDLGSEVFVHFGVGAPAVRGEDVQAALGAEALEATSSEALRKGSLFTARVSRDSRAREGEPVELAVNPS